MRRIFLIFACVLFFSIESCVDVPENPVYVTVVNITNEKILVTNLPTSIEVGSSKTTVIEKGSTIEVTGVYTKRKYGSRTFYWMHLV
jgi:hypothetical protein